MERLGLVIATITLLCLTVFPTNIVKAGSGPTTTAYLAINPVTVDGKWTNSTEWADAAEVKLLVVQGSGVAYMRTKHDPNHLYILVDVLSDVSGEGGDYCALYVDGKHDGGAAPQADDFILLERWGGPTMFNTLYAAGGGGTWGGWEPTIPSEFEGRTSVNAVDDPYSTVSHVIYEFQIPLRVLNATNIGFYVVVYDNVPVNQLTWPMASESIPNDWGNISISSVVIPEFPAAQIILFVILAATVALFRVPVKPRKFS